LEYYSYTCRDGAMGPYKISLISSWLLNYLFLTCGEEPMRILFPENILGITVLTKIESFECIETTYERGQHCIP